MAKWQLIGRCGARWLAMLMLVGIGAACSTFAAPSTPEVRPSAASSASTAVDRAVSGTPGQPTQAVRTCTRVYGPLQTVAEAADPAAMARIAHLRLVDGMLEAM